MSLENARKYFRNYIDCEMRDPAGLNGTAKAMLAFLRADLSATAQVTGETSDGYHTFNELYEHRHILFLHVLISSGDKAWRSKLHSDGTMFDGWFIAGLNTKMGQATYHLPLRMWELFDDITELERAPEFDGHTANDTLVRIREEAYWSRKDATAQDGVDIRRHAGNPRLIRVKGLKIIEMPECEGGGYAMTGAMAEIIARSLSTTNPDSGCESCEGFGRINCDPDEDGHTHPCDSCQPEMHKEFQRGYDAAMHYEIRPPSEDARRALDDFNMTMASGIGPEAMRAACKFLNEHQGVIRQCLQAKAGG